MQLKAIHNLFHNQPATLICSAKTDFDYDSLQDARNVVLVNDALKLAPQFKNPIGVSFHWDCFTVEARSCMPVQFLQYGGLGPGNDQTIYTHQESAYSVSHMMLVPVRRMVDENKLWTMLNSGLAAFQILRILGASEINAIGCRGTGNHDPRLGGLPNPDPAMLDALNLEVAEYLKINWLDYKA